MLFGGAMHSLRILRRNKRFAALAVLSLGIGIGLNTTMYTVLDALVNPVVEMRDPDRLFRVAFYGDFLQPRRITKQMHAEALESLRSFEEGAGVYLAIGQGLAERGNNTFPARVVNVTPNYFQMLGNAPLAGRLLSDVDANVEPRPVVISERLWRQLFPERENFDSGTIIIGEEPRVVVGVLARTSDFPSRYPVDVWQLLPAGEGTYGWGGTMNLLRLKPGVSIHEAWAELRVIANRFAAITGEDPKYVDYRITPAIEDTPQMKSFHVALGMAVLAVLLVACVNLANLQLARGISRARELATRSALGASRTQLVRQLVGESAWIAAGGLLLGLLLTAWGMQLVASAVPPSFEDLIVRPRASWRLFAFAAATTAVSLGFVGLLPAIRLSRVNINEVMKSGAGTGRTRRASLQYGSLVVVQIGLSLALLVGAMLLTRGAVAVFNVDVPEHYDRLMFGQLRIGEAPTWLRARVGSPTLTAERREATDQRRLTDIGNHLLNRLGALPQISGAAVSVSRAPIGLTISLADPGGTPREIVTGMRFSYQSVSSEYPRILGYEVHRGRGFQPGEFAEPFVIVDDRTARYLWPGQDAVGKRIKFGRDSSRAPWLEVIGVVRPVNYMRPLRQQEWEVLLAPGMGSVFVLNGTDPSIVGAGALLQLVATARRADDVQTLPNQIRTLLRDPAAQIGVSYVESWERMTGLDRLREQRGFVASLFTTFALLAVGVAALGVYAIVSHSVSRRAREIGVRMALGAEQRDIRRSVLFEGNVLALTGIALGLIIAGRTVGLLDRYLPSENDKFDAPFFALVALMLFAVAWLASYLPARRAMRIDPTEALRHD